MFDIRDLIIIFLTIVIFLLLVNNNQRKEPFISKNIFKHSSVYY